MTATPHLDRLIATCDNIRAETAAYDFAYHNAVGVFTDVAEHPTISVIVYQGKLFHLALNDGYVSAVERGEMELDDVQTIVNGALLNGFVQWRADVKRLLEVAGGEGAGVA